VALPENAILAHRGAFWLSIARILLVEILVLIALAGAAVVYLDWSSEAAWSEFLAASKWQSLEANQTLHTIKDLKSCNRKA
jgi:hypothetical protein